jgi:hypothetical protein
VALNLVLKDGVKGHNIKETTLPGSPVLQDGVKGHPIKETTLPGSPALQGGELHYWKSSLQTGDQPIPQFIVSIA